jgi:hypothetical protein
VIKSDRLLQLDKKDLKPAHEFKIKDDGLKSIPYWLSQPYIRVMSPSVPGEIFD